MAWQNGILPLRFRTPRCSMGGGAPISRCRHPKEVLVIFLRWNVIRWYQMAKCRNETVKHDQMAFWAAKTPMLIIVALVQTFFQVPGGLCLPVWQCFFAAYTGLYHPLLWVTKTLQVLTKNLNLDAPSAHTPVKAHPLVIKRGWHENDKWIFQFWTSSIIINGESSSINDSKWRIHGEFSWIVHWNTGTCYPFMARLLSRPSTAPGTMLRPRVESPAGASKLKTLGDGATALDVASYRDGGGPKIVDWTYI